MLRLVSVLFFSFVAATFSTAVEESLEDFVQLKSDEILALINDGRAGFEDDPSVLYGQMGSVLDQLVDFEILSRGVMGKHYKVATDDQRLEFQEYPTDSSIAAAKHAGHSHNQLQK